MTNNLDADMDAAGDAGTDKVTLAQITTHAKRAKQLMDNIDHMEEAVKNLKDELNSLRHDKIPELMASAQLLHFKLDDGTVVKVDDFCSGSLPKDPDKRAKALALLLEYGAASLIKTDVEVTFDRHEHGRALAVAKELRDKGLTVDVAEGVHAQTLQAFARERLRNGEQVDTATLGLYVGRVAKLALPKVKP